MLDISKLDAGKTKLQVKAQSFFPFINNLIADFTVLAKQKNIDVITNYNHTDKMVWFDKDALEKILSNLLSNAIKYTLENGKISLDTQTKDGVFIFKVKNTGKGLSKKDQKLIFNRFHQVDEHTIGAGIGLSLVKDLIKLHKGSIQVDSEINQWTCFKINIPIARTNYIGLISVEESIHTHNKKEINSITETVLTNEMPILLIVEDNDELRSFISQIFKNEFQILIAKNGKEGYELALKHMPDIIISDIMMPIMDGISLSNKLTNNILTSHIPIVLLTAKTSKEDELIGVKTGAIDYITKPFQTEVLYLKIKNILKNQLALQAKFNNQIFKTKEIPFSRIDKQFIDSIKEILDDKLIEPSFNVSNFSKDLGMSRMQLHRKLKALTGLSASEFIKTQRLKLATELLKNSDVNIAEIGYSIGFNDAAYFSKCFKEYFGCTPTEYINMSST